jgi:HK97 family phage major capsid protein
MTVKKYLEQKRKQKAKDTIMPGPSVTQTKEAADKEQRKAFYKAFIEKDRAGMAQISEQVAKDYKTKGQSVAVNADGGYLVPVSIADSILQKRTQLSGFRAWRRPSPTCWHSSICRLKLPSRPPTGSLKVRRSPKASQPSGASASH